ncbi:transposase InsO family protein [Variovorax boronicumulans]|nr:transposase InsO family protein [Variovorax boronicumulans]MDQ0005252.1 transposase InsO family protein [Variovorax boronicumulans]MDQ0036653.1 transposase InsO family protein [Variovorax boronicumulans]
MARKGCSSGNAACEGFFGRLKRELFYPRDWKATTIEQFIEVVDSYIGCYNETRIKLSLALSAPSNTDKVSDLRPNKTSPSFDPHLRQDNFRLAQQAVLDRSIGS